MDESSKLQPHTRLKWAQIEAYVYQVIILAAQNLEINQKLEELKKTVKEELQKKSQ